MGKGWQANLDENGNLKRNADGTPDRSNPQDSSFLGAPGRLVGPSVSQLQGLGGLVTPEGVDTSALKDAQQRAADTQAFYRDRLVNLPPEYNPAHSAQLYNEGQGAIADLTAASKGLVPSAAELQLRQQANTNAARNFGAAQAIQGRSPGAALRMATTGATDTQALANAQAAQLRAQEQAAARGQLVQAIGGQQNAEQGLRTGDIQQTGQLIQADTSALDSNAKAAAAVAAANAQAAASQNAFKGGLINGAVSWATKPGQPGA